MKLLTLYFLGVLLSLSFPAAADKGDKKRSIEARYAYSMGYRVGQSLLAQGRKDLDVDTIAQGVRDVLAGRKKRIEAKDGSAAAEAYLMGYQLGQSMQAQGVKKLDVASLVDGIGDPLQQRKPRMDEVEMNDALVSYAKFNQARSQNDSSANLARAQSFLDGNRRRQGVVERPSGLQYEILKPANGTQPGVHDKVLVHYQGSFIDGTVFDSSISRGKPARFPLNQVVAGFREALTNMHVGEKWRIYIPPELAYGSRGVQGVIGTNQLLIFEIELLEII